MANFSVALSSKPRKNVTVTIKSQSVTDQWGAGRYEGVPAIANDTQLLATKNSPCTMLHSMQSKDCDRLGQR